jgi:hypothetical protein
VAVITARVLELTGDGITVKLAVVAPESTGTDAGTEAELLLESATLVLLVGATFRVTVQVDVAGAVMFAGLHVRLVGTAAAAGRRVSKNVFEMLFSAAVITGRVLELTGDGITVKLAVVEPEVTVTDAGTEAEALLLESATLVLLLGATFRVMVQVEVAGALMLAGLHVRLVGTPAAGGRRVTENV